MLIVTALGGNALLKRGEPMTAENQRKQRAHRVRGAGPDRPGASARHRPRQRPAGRACWPCSGPPTAKVEPYPFDVLGAETEGMIGYMIEQELGNLLPFERPFATLLTMIEVDPEDPAFKDPTKFIGPVYDKADADRLAGREGLDLQAGRRQVAAGGAVADAQADLRAAADQVAARAATRW